MKIIVTSLSTEYGLEKPQSEKFFKSSFLVRECRRCYLSLISNLCKAAQTSLFWASDKLNKLLEVGFEIPFNLIGKSTMAVLTGLSWHILKSWYRGPGIWISVLFHRSY